MTTEQKNKKVGDGISVTPISTRDDRLVQIAGMSADRLSAIVRASENGNSAEFWRLANTVIIQDSHIQSELFKRKAAVLGDELIVTPWDGKNPADVEAAEAVEAMLLNFPDIFKANIHLLDATLYPLSIVEKVFAPADPSIPELGRRFRLAELVPVPYRLISWDQDGQPIVSDRGDIGGFLHSEPLDPQRYILHRGHMLTTPDRFGGPMRSVFWLWLLSSMAITWWARYLERFGSPFIVGKAADGSNDNDRRILESAISYSTQLGGLVISGDSQVELKESAKDSGGGFEAFRNNCRREISRLILGQTLSSEAQPTGLGSGTATLQGDVRYDIRDYDARSLCETLRAQLVEQWLRLNGFSGRAPILTFAEDTTEEVSRTAELLQTLGNAGYEPTDDALTTIGSRLGFPIQRKPAPSHAFFSAAELGGGSDKSFFRRDPYRR